MKSPPVGGDTDGAKMEKPGTRPGFSTARLKFALEPAANPSGDAHVVLDLPAPARNFRKVGEQIDRDVRGWSRLLRDCGQAYETKQSDKTR